MLTNFDKPHPTEIDLIIQTFRELFLDEKEKVAKTYLIKSYMDLAKAFPNCDLFGIGTELERALLFPWAWSAMATIKGPKERGPNDWNGECLREKHLVVEKRSRDIGADLRMGRLIQLAGRQSGQCTAFVEKRLVSLFARSFPSATIKTAPDRQTKLEGFDCSAGYEILGHYLVPTAHDIFNSFIPLVADAGVTEKIRTSYLAASNGQPVVGLSWHSSNENKDMPPLSFWAEVAGRLPFTCVSINYGDRAEDIEYLQAYSGKTIVPDPIDQRASLDNFAAQVSAVDLVVSISNSTAHMAGALGQSLELVLSTFAGMTWPIWGASTPWYPTARLHRKAVDWNEEIDAIVTMINAKLG